METIVIGIEGLVGAGKSSICRRLLKMLPNSILLNGGNLYRAIVYAIMKSGKTMEQLQHEMKKADIKEWMDQCQVELKIEEQETRLYIAGKLVKEEELQSKEASMAVSVVGGMADNTKLFEFARELINKFKAKYNVIVAGRSILEIYPDCDYHFFITASLEERIKRKCIQYNKDREEEKEEIRKNIMKRDELQEKAGFYKIQERTIVVDVTECRDVEESTKKVWEKIKVKQNV